MRRRTRRPTPATRRRALLRLGWAAALAGAGLGPAARGAEAATSGGAPALLAAAARGDLAAVQQLVRSGAPIEARDGERRTPLLAATRGGHSALAVWLIGQGADVNSQDAIDDSAFLLAGASGLVDIVRAALPASDPRRLNRYGGTALIPACHHGHVETVKVLLEWKGPNRIAIDHVNRLGWSALLEAVILGDGGPSYVEIVRLLLAHGANAHLADRDGVTPLAHAVTRRLGAMAQLLQRAGSPERR